MPEAILKSGDPVTLPEDGKGRVLVIDDEADIRESLETLLTLEGYSVDLAQNAAEGLRALDSKGIEYEVHDLSEDPAALAEVKALGYLQAPVVVTDEDHWSGFRPDKIDELASRLA